MSNTRSKLEVIKCQGIRKADPKGHGGRLLNEKSDAAWPPERASCRASFSSAASWSAMNCLSMRLTQVITCCGTHTTYVLQTFVSRSQPHLGELCKPLGLATHRAGL